MLCVRPHFEQFVARCARAGITLAVWTAASNRYAALVTRYLFGPGCANLLFVYDGSRCPGLNRPDVTSAASRNAASFWKPLKKVWRRADVRKKGFGRHNTLMVDDTPTNFVNNRDNGVFIPRFDHRDAKASQDDYLLHLATWLEHAAKLQEPDVRLLDRHEWLYGHAPGNNCRDGPAVPLCERPQEEPVAQPS